MKADDKWAEKLRHKMDNYAEPLPEDMWTRIEHDMSVPKVVPMWRRAWSYAAVILVLCVSVLSVWLWSLTPDTSADLAELNRVQDDVVQTVSQEVVSSPEIPVSNTDGTPVLDEVVPSVGVSSAAENRPMLMASAPKMVIAGTVQHEAMVMSIDDYEETEECEAETLAPTARHDVETDVDHKAAVRSRVLSDRAVMAENLSHEAMKHKAGRRRNWNLGLSAGNIPYTASHSNVGMSSLNPLVAYKYVEDANTKVRSITSFMPFRRFETEVRHKMPIVVNAVFRYHFTPRWGIETGLSYTLLSSDWVSAEGVNVYQKLHYIGIPLKASYNIVNSRYFTLYASAGGMMEKCVYAEMGRRETANPDSESLDEKPFQWSVSAALGAQFNIIRQLGLFVEPGVTYYFDDNSGYETIRKEYPFNFSLNLGLRITFGR